MMIYPYILPRRVDDCDGDRCADLQDPSKIGLRLAADRTRMEMLGYLRPLRHYKIKAIFDRSKLKP